MDNSKCVHKTNSGGALLDTIQVYGTTTNTGSALCKANDSSTEQITKLFPKCRPRSTDLNLNSLVVVRASVIANDTDARDDVHIEEVIHDGVLAPSTERVIEIAGGREIYSQSRAKALRKSRNNEHVIVDKKRNVWDMRNTPANGVKHKHSNSKTLKYTADLFTETVFSTEVSSMTVPRTNAITNCHKFDGVDSSSNDDDSNVTSRGMFVVFDDIDGAHGETTSRGTSPLASPSHNDDFYQVVSTKENCRNGADNAVVQVIGSTPIAVYDGSPRRYGPRATSIEHSDEHDVNIESDTHPTLPSAHTLLASPSYQQLRPGFPQRIVGDKHKFDNKSLNDLVSTTLVSLNSSTASNRAHDVNSSASTFNYIYEFSETRKVLEEFFKCPQNDVKDDVKSRNDDVVEHINNFLDLSVGTASSGELPETEVGLQVGQGRNFTLSPDTTDCDSNCGDLDSEMSLMLVDNDVVPAAAGLLGSNGDLATSDMLRVYSCMPVLEDGLSSGHASDTDNNPTMLLMKQQINEIQLEVKRGDNGRRIAAISVSPTCNADDYMSHIQMTDPLVPPPAPAPYRRVSDDVVHDVGQIVDQSPNRVEAAIQDIRLALQKTKTLPVADSPVESPKHVSPSPIWVRRQGPTSRSSKDSDSEEPKITCVDNVDDDDADTDLETDRLLGQHRTDDQGFYDEKESEKKKCRNKEVKMHDLSVLIEGVLFRARYLGSTQLVCEGQPTKNTRMIQAEEAVSRIKALAPDGETQPSTEVDLFISTEKIMVLNTDLKEIMMDHALRTISYIADIGDLVVLMARRRLVPHEMDDPPKINRTPKMICHVFESEEAQFIAQSIGQAFQVAYMEFLKANGIEDHSFVKEMDYQEVLNSQEIYGDELEMFARKEMQKEVVVPKAKGEILGVVIVESGWGSMLPTVVIANLAPAGAAARCGQLNIGDQIIAINGVSLVGLPLSTCQSYIKNSKNQTVVKLTVVPCAPVVEVKIKRPDTKYQLGFSVQNGVICSLLRGGIAERGGIRVGHRIIEINNQSVVAVPHEKIVNLLATSVGEILMKTMPTSMFRLLTGQENPFYI